SVLSAICDANKRKNRLIDRPSSDIYICNISTPQRCINPKMLVSSVRDIMDADHTVCGLCITENESVVGIITRSELYRRLSSLYGYSLHTNKPIETIMSRDFLCVDYHDSIEAVAKSAMNRAYDKLYDLVTVIKNSRYYGIVTVKDLLEKALQIGINNARHLNPLSGLPGNVAIERELERCIGLGEELLILYCDMDNFKAYNDVYGFENGDLIIKCLTAILKSNINGFVGHIGGDDFVAIVPADGSAELCDKIMAEFDAAVKSYYSNSDLDRGYITTRNRHGIEEDFPILSISITAVPNKGHHTVFSLSEDMARLKKACKQLPGSNFLIK
ncbi:MAG TPA: GGDEF domain-containing protein, partial [Rectinemataceae bacterium]|nr:GGDEF domain-containing protein [Rectinemataceae bacterium]